MGNTRMKQTVNATNFLYEFLQHHIRPQDDHLYRCIVRDLIVKLGIWFPLSIYPRLPILLPHVVRDASARKGARLNQEEAWGSPNRLGYLRDDNSLVKGLVDNLGIYSPTFRPYKDRYRGNGFWAAHIWNRTNDDKPATKLASVNSFVPNLVWLPSSVARLTDVKGDYAQLLVRAISKSLYGSVEVPLELLRFTNEAWNRLPTNETSFEDELPGPEELNYFKVTPRFLETRLIRINAALTLVRWVENGRPSDRPVIPKRVLPRRYIEGLESMDSLDVEELSDYLQRYSLAVRRERS